MEIRNQGNVQVWGQSTAGPINWQVVSPAAELMFALWVIGRKLPHPQWMDRSWIPPNWIPWAAQRGKQTPFSDASDVNAFLDAIE